ASYVMRREKFNLQPHLVGELLELRPLSPDDWEGLFAAAADPMIWELHPAHDRYKEEVFREYFQEALASGGALAAWTERLRKLSARHGTSGTDLSRANLRSAGRSSPAPIGVEITTER